MKGFRLTVKYIFFLILFSSIYYSCNQNKYENETCFETSNRILASGKLSFNVEENCFCFTTKKDVYKFKANYLSSEDVFDYQFEKISWLNETYDYLRNISESEKESFYILYPNIEDFFIQLNDALMEKNNVVSKAYINYANNKLADFKLEFPSDREMEEITTKNNDEIWYKGTLRVVLKDSKTSFDLLCEYKHGDRGFAGQTDDYYENRLYGDCPNWFIKAFDYYQPKDGSNTFNATNMEAFVRKIFDLFFDRLEKGL